LIKGGKVDLENLPRFRSDLMLREEKKAGVDNFVKRQTVKLVKKLDHSKLDEEAT
jgi:hypothetical protein